jgi:hypothetical protein
MHYSIRSSYTRKILRGCFLNGQLEYHPQFVLTKYYIWGKAQGGLLGGPFRTNPIRTYSQILALYKVLQLLHYKRETA